MAINLNSIFDQVLQTVIKNGPRPPVEACFYPYAGLSSTIRLRQGRLYVRISDVMVDSSEEVLHALAYILVAKLYRRKPAKEYERIYREYASRAATLTASEDARRQRGYKMITSPQGKVYDLEEVFVNLNRQYFHGELGRPVLSWSRTRTGRVLGHHDHIHGAIIISRTLDSPRIPRFVLEYVLYHEMLHVKYPPRQSGGRTVYHGREFRADERRFEQFGEALEWLDRITKPIRRRKSSSPRAKRSLRNGK